jgi:hypothetical protein
MLISAFFHRVYDTTQLVEMRSHIFGAVHVAPYWRSLDVSPLRPRNTYG